MKNRFCIYKFGKEEKIDKKDNSIFFENGLFLTCIVVFFILIAVQIALVIPNVRDNFNLSDRSIGIPLKGDEYLYNQGQVTLKMMGDEPDSMVKILINGDYTAMFENLEMNINVKDGDVIEIDGSKSLLGHVVMVKELTSNIDRECGNAVAKVESNLQTLVKIRIN
jgi:hypothetical protein